MTSGARELIQPCAAPAAANGDSVYLPHVAVRTDGAAVAAFARETGAAPSEGFVPLTYPFCWVTLPAIRPIIAQMTGEGFLPIHEAQSFEYERSLESDADYVLAVELHREAEPLRLILRATISTPQGRTCGRFETVLRIVPLALAPAS